MEATISPLKRMDTVLSAFPTDEESLTTSTAAVPNPTSCSKLFPASFMAADDRVKKSTIFSLVRA